MALLILGASAPAAGSPPAGTVPPFLRGMTVSCPRYGVIWGSPKMAEALEELGGLGVEWVAIHPYGRVERDGSVRFHPAAESGYLGRAVELSRNAGIQLFWKPHLAYWGSFKWRGEIDFGDDAAAWDRFFSSYRAFMLDQARFAASAGVPLLAIGVELEGTTRFEARWRRLIAEVRAVFPGRITYAANWDRLDGVPFWDAVDWIGVQAYFPLSDLEAPSVEDLRRGWDAPLAALETLSGKHGGKGVLFAEVGYDLSPSAAKEPWASGRGDSASTRALRRRLMDVALERAAVAPFLRGMFWWKWIPGATHRFDDFSMRRPEAKEALRRAWGERESREEVVSGGAFKS